MSSLFALRDTLRRHGLLSTSQLATLLEIPRETAENMLHYWQNRGRVMQMNQDMPKSCGSSCTAGACGSCGSGQRSKGEVWRWVDTPGIDAAPVIFHSQTRSRETHTG